MGVGRFVGLELCLLQSPVTLVWLGGIVLAIVSWRRHPRVSLLAAIAMGLLLVSSVVGNLANAWLPLGLHRQGRNLVAFGLAGSAISFLRSLFTAGVWVLLLAAIFGWRGDGRGGASGS